MQGVGNIDAPVQEKIKATKGTDQGKEVMQVQSDIQEQRRNTRNRDPNAWKVAGKKKNQRVFDKVTGQAHVNTSNTYDDLNDVLEDDLGNSIVETRNVQTSKGVATGNAFDMLDKEDAGDIHDGQKIQVEAETTTNEIQKGTESTSLNKAVGIDALGQQSSALIVEFNDVAVNEDADLEKRIKAKSAAVCVNAGGRDKELNNATMSNEAEGLKQAVNAPAGVNTMQTTQDEAQTLDTVAAVSQNSNADDLSKNFVLNVEALSNVAEHDALENECVPVVVDLDTHVDTTKTPTKNNVHILAALSKKMTPKILRKNNVSATETEKDAHTLSDKIKAQVRHTHEQLETEDDHHEASMILSTAALKGGLPVNDLMYLYQAGSFSRNEAGNLVYLPNGSSYEFEFSNREEDVTVSQGISMENKKANNDLAMEVDPHSEKVPTDDDLFKQMDWHDTQGILERQGIHGQAHQGHYLLENDDMYEEEELDEESIAYNFSIVAREGDLSPRPIRDKTLKKVMKERRPLEPTRVQPSRSTKTKKVSKKSKK